MTDEQKEVDKQTKIAGLQARLRQEIPPSERKMITSILKLWGVEPEVAEPSEEVVESEE